MLVNLNCYIWSRLQCNFVLTTQLLFIRKITNKALDLDSVQQNVVPVPPFGDYSYSLKIPKGALVVIFSWGSDARDIFPSLPLELLELKEIKLNLLEYTARLAASSTLLPFNLFLFSLNQQTYFLEFSIATSLSWERDRNFLHLNRWRSVRAELFSRSYQLSPAQSVSFDSPVY